MTVEPRSDEALLAATPAEPAAFGVFYARHESVVLLFFLRRTQNAELAADLTAETFAAALVSAERFRPGPTPAVGWLFGIARNTWAMSARRGQVEARARRRLGMPRLVLDDDVLERVADVVGDSEAVARLDDLPETQREAVRARVLDDREYDEIARELRCSEAVVRKRVSRGLAALRSHMEGDRG